MEKKNKKMGKPKTNNMRSSADGRRPAVFSS